MAKKQKMNESSLIILGAAAFLISMLGTLSILSSPTITGFAPGDTASGRVNATVDAVVDISLPTSAVAFGSMEPNELNCTGNYTAGINPPRGLHVQNDGNVKVDINITSKKTGTTGSLFNGTATSANFEWNCSTTSNGTDPNLYGYCNLSSWSAAATTLTAAGDPGVVFVTYLNYSDTTDNATLHTKIRIPADEPAWTTGSTITFGAWQNTP